MVTMLSTNHEKERYKVGVILKLYGARTACETVAVPTQERQYSNANPEHPDSKDHEDGYLPCKQYRVELAEHYQEEPGTEG